MPQENKMSSIQLIILKDRLRPLEYLYIQLLDHRHKTIMAYWSNKRDHIFPHVPFGDYEIRLSTARGDRKDYVIGLDSEEYAFFAESPGDNKWSRIILSASQNAINPPQHDAFSKTNIKYSIPVVMWELRDQKWMKGNLTELPCFGGQQVRYEIMMDSEYVSGIEFLSPSEKHFGQSRFLIIPPGRSRIIITCMQTWLMDGEFVKVKILLEDEPIDALVDLLQTGNLTLAGQLMREKDGGYYLSQSGVNDIRSLIVAYYLFKSYKIREDLLSFKNLILKNSLFTDGIVISAWLLVYNYDQTLIRYDLLRDHLLRVVIYGIPNMSEGVKLIHEGLSQLAAYYRHDPSDEIHNAQKQVTDWMRHLVKNQPFTMFKNYRPIEYSNNWEPAGGMDSLEPIVFDDVIY